MDRIDYLVNRFALQNIVISSDQAMNFSRYYDLLVEWNQKINLTAITDFEQVVDKHFIDSVLCCNEFGFSEGKCLIDVGSGAGFPGVPIKILFPDLRVVLLDSLNKRVTYLNEVINSLGLSGISAVHGRAEDFGIKPDFRDSFDYCVSRAVSRLDSLCEYCMPFVKKGGLFISYKSSKADEELASSQKAISELGGSFERSVVSSLDIDGSNRTLLVIRKTDSTPKKYPRQRVNISKNPIA